jgi:hypothetical protein
MEPDQTLNEVEPSKQVEGIDPVACTESIPTAEANADAAVPAADSATAEAPADAGAPPQVDPVAAEAVTASADDSGAPASEPPQE